MNQTIISRRSVLLGAATLGAAALSGCASTGDVSSAQALAAAKKPDIAPSRLAMYGPLPDEKFPVPAVDLTEVDDRFLRTVIDDPTGEKPGTVVVSTGERMLYLVRDDGQAVRYGVGIGRAGFAWSGRARIAWKRPWPIWTPPAEMIAREPDLEPWRNGMPPGLENPLGARALYIFDDGVDTLYRLHGTTEAWSIGQAVSSGCVRLLNQDVIDLYRRVPTPSPILVV
ncbi:MAG: L,D-transpeptidase [Alphaproteobacteria bacterium]